MRKTTRKGGLLKRFRSCFHTQDRIVSADRNILLDMSDRSETKMAYDGVLKEMRVPFQRDRLEAYLNCAGDWDLYLTSNKKLKPVRKTVSVQYHGVPRDHSVWEHRKPKKIVDKRPRKLASGLSLTQIFERMRLFENAEQFPGARTCRLAGDVFAKKFLEIDAPTTNPEYWRNIKKNSLKP